MNLPERILVLVPHPDDEVLLAGGVIRRAVLEHKRVFAAVATNGDYLCKDTCKGEQRLSESLTALSFLGVPEEDIFFLGYPDTGMEPEVSFLNALRCADNPDTVFPSARGTTTYGIAAKKQDFAFLRTGSHAAYCQNSFVQDIAALLQATQPQLVITTAAADVHGDHAALSYFVREALRAANAGAAQPIRLWEGFVHSPAGDESWPPVTADMPLLCEPQGLFEASGLRWSDRISVPVPAEMLCDMAADSKKQAAIRLYTTALNPAEPEVCDYLLAFAKADEVFWEISV